MKNPFEIPACAVAFFAMAFFTQKTTAQQTLIGSTDLPAYIREVQPITDNLSEAMRRTYGTDQFSYNTYQVESFYKKLEDRIAAVQARYHDFYAKKQQTATYSEADAKNDINKNPIIANMGGMDAVMGMSEEQARAAATNATAQYVADPFAANGVQSAGMKALYQKIVTDPAYAERFNKMSEKEKEAELRKYMANDQPVAMGPEQAKAHQEKVKQQNIQADKVRNAQEIQLKMHAWAEEMQAAGEVFGEKVIAIQNQPGNHRDIDASFEPRFQAVPIVELGEYGHDKDPEMMQALYLEASEVHRQQAEKELRQMAAPLLELKESYSKIAGDYMAWIKVNAGKVNGDMADYFNGTHTEIQLGGFEMGLLEMANSLIEQIENYTKEAAQWQRRYLELRKD